MARRSAQGQGHLDQGGAARPEADRRPRQHLCLRGAVSRRHLADQARGHARHQIRQADREDGSAGRRHQGRAGRRHQGRRLVAARLQARRRQARPLPAPLQDLRPRGQALPAEKAAEEPYAASSREDARPSIVQPVNARGLEPHVRECLHRQGTRTRGGAEKDRRLRDDPRHHQGQSRAHHAQPPARAERAQHAAHQRAQPRARRVRGRPRDRLHRHHRQREGVRRRRRHQGDAVQKTFVEAYGSDFLAPFDRSATAASRSSRRSPAMRWAAAASWP